MQHGRTTEQERGNAARWNSQLPVDQSLDSIQVHLVLGVLPAEGLNGFIVAVVVQSLQLRTRLA